MRSRSSTPSTYGEQCMERLGDIEVHGCSGCPSVREVAETEGAEAGNSQMQQGCRYLAKEPGLYPVPTNPV